MDTVYGEEIDQTWATEMELEVSQEMVGKLDDFINFVDTLSFCNFEITCRIKVEQQNEGLPDNRLPMGNEWNLVRNGIEIVWTLDKYIIPKYTQNDKLNWLFLIPIIRTTLSRLLDNGITNLDAPRDGMGAKYCTNLNHKIKWVAGEGPVCQEEMLPDKCGPSIHKNIRRTCSEMFYDDFMDRLLALEVTEAIKFIQKMCLSPLRFLLEFQKRSSFMFNYDGTPKMAVFWPKNTQLNPFRVENHSLIEQTCLDEPATRKLLGKVDLHRTDGATIPMVASLMVEMR